jgi:hypothetical protein
MPVKKAYKWSVLVTLGFAAIYIVNSVLMMNSSVVEYEKRSISNAIRTAPVKATISSAEQIQPLMKALMSTIVPSELSSDDSDSPLPVTIQTPQDTAYNHHKPIYKPMTIFTESEASVESERYNQTASIHPSEDPDMMQRGQVRSHYNIQYHFTSLI